MSYQSISQITDDLFGENLNRRFMIRTIQEMAFNYSETEKGLYSIYAQVPLYMLTKPKLV